MLLLYPCLVRILKNTPVRLVKDVLIRANKEEEDDTSENWPHNGGTLLFKAG